MAFIFFVHILCFGAMGLWPSALCYLLSLDMPVLVVNFNSVVIDIYIVSFDMTDCCCFWKWCCAGLFFRDDLLGAHYAAHRLSQH
jgi:hypothetical protein